MIDVRKRMARTMLPWDDLQTFLSIARHGTLSAAARALGVQQSTMGRRLMGLEERAGARLLAKTPSGFVMTPAGEAILGHVERIEAETLAIEHRISGPKDGTLGRCRQRKTPYRRPDRGSWQTWNDPRGASG